MFVLVEMVDTVRIPPQGFQRRLNDAIAEELNEKLSNRVVHNVGLCVCLYDVTKLHDSYIFPGDDGASHTKVHFRCIVFRPFLDEILVGKVKRCGPDGVHVTMGFFDDILVPPHLLQQPARFDEAKQAWLWLYETAGKGGGEAVHFYQVDRGEEIRFRVTDEIFRDTSPTGPAAAPAIKTGTPALPGRSGGAPPTPAEDGGQEKEAPYVLIGSICEPVLGPLSWWSS